PARPPSRPPSNPPSRPYSRPTTKPSSRVQSSSNLRSSVIEPLESEAHEESSPTQAEVTKVDGGLDSNSENIAISRSGSTYSLKKSETAKISRSGSNSSVSAPAKSLEKKESKVDLLNSKQGSRANVRSRAGSNSSLAHAVLDSNFRKAQTCIPSILIKVKITQSKPVSRTNSQNQVTDVTPVTDNANSDQTTDMPFQGHDVPSQPKSTSRSHSQKD
ncbi:hypothetical protein HDU67_004677, partial [Dinochytrium kinnereticum]